MAEETTKVSTTKKVEIADPKPVVVSKPAPVAAVKGKLSEKATRGTLDKR